MSIEQKDSNESKKSPSLVSKLPMSPFERVFDGPLTQELLLQPSKFGLGLVPERKQPNATTSMVCGFCSTGCSLTCLLYTSPSPRDRG